MKRTAARLGALLAVPALFTAVYGRYGHGGADDGFITALSWRVLQGQVLYLDFVYIRPPGSVLLHALPLWVFPGSYLVLSERFLFYFFIAAYSYVSVLILDRWFDLRALGLGRFLLAALFFVLSVQNFPPMPWHTVDGILMSVLALYFLACLRAPWGWLGGAAFLFLAASCKQSFFFMVPFGLAYALLVRGRKDFLLALATVAALVAAAFAGLARLGALGEFASQITSQTRARSLLRAGVVAYFDRTAMVAGPGLVAFAILDRLGLTMRGRRLGRAALPYVMVGAILAISVLHVMVKQRFVTPAYNYPGFLFLVTLVALLFEVGRARGEIWTLGCMLSVSWCASLSWGYPSPALYAAPFAFGVLHFSRRHLGTRPRPLAAFFLALAVVAQFAAYRFPYGDGPRAELKHALGEAFPQLGGIYTSRANLERHLELRLFHERYGSSFTVLPAMPLAGLLTGSVPPIPVDWARNAEIGSRTRELIAALEERRPYVFLEASAAACGSGPACSDLARHVAERWTPLEKGKHLHVYAPGERASPQSPGTTDASEEP